MKRTSFGSSKGEGKVGAIGDNRYGLREQYDPKVKEKTLNEKAKFRKFCTYKRKNFLRDTIVKKKVREDRLKQN